MAPWDFSASAATLRDALAFGAIGFGFGAALEMAGFGDTRKLAGQFYLREMTVLKVMFTAIAVAAVLLALASSFGLLDMTRVWVNPTYLWPGIVGGLIMGVGFVIGGFCPGTSAVAAATLKVDGMLFLLGVLFGVFAFGESVAGFEAFFLSSAMGRFTLPEWLGLSTGATVSAVVAMALAMFYLAELAEQHYGQKRPWPEIALVPGRRLIAGAGLLAAASLVALAHGQPSPAQKWSWVAADVKRSVEERGVFVHPAEVVQLRQDPSVQVAIYDLRSETDFNLFHLGGSRRLDPGQLGSPAVVKPLLEAPSSTVAFLVSNGEQASLAAWKALKAQGAANLYVVEGGINRWLELYPAPVCVARRAADAPSEPESLGYQFAYSVGSRVPAAWPELPTSRQFRSPCEEEERGGEARAGAHAGGMAWPNHPFTRRVKLKTKVAMKGGCG